MRFNYGPADAQLTFGIIDACLLNCLLIVIAKALFLADDCTTAALENNYLSVRTQVYNFTCAPRTYCLRLGTAV